MSESDPGHRRGAGQSAQRGPAERNPGERDPVPWHPVGLEPGRSQPARPLDQVDRRIVAELARDGRMSMRVLAERVHVSRANAYARVERLQRDGVITGFAAQINPERAGLGTSAFVLLNIQQNAWREVAAVLLTVPYVEHIALVGGDFDVLVRLRAPDNSVLRHLVLERIQDVRGVQATRTWLVFDEADGLGADWEEAFGTGRPRKG